jgi:hypothetical protein
MGIDRTTEGENLVTDIEVMGTFVTVDGEDRAGNISEG